MASYKIFFKASSEKELRKIPSAFLHQILAKINALAEEPRPAQSRILKGENRFFRLRQGDYRIIYEVNDEERLVRIIKMGHRREVYD